MKHLQIFITICLAILLVCPKAAISQKVQTRGSEQSLMHHEVPDQKYAAPLPGATRTSAAYNFESAGFFTKQVNVNASGNNILGDAANEPSLAVDPVNPARMVIGWRQFDDVNNNFRQAGYGYTTNGGQNWTFPGVIQPTVFRSDPVLDFDREGNFYYNSLTTATGSYTCDVFKSTNGGISWDMGTAARGGDKQWMAIDRTNGPGVGNIYSCWNSAYTSCDPGFFTRSANAGLSFEDCIMVDGFPYWGTMTVGPSGELYISSAGPSDGINVVKSTNAQTPGSTITWDNVSYADMDGYVVGSDPINPVGLLGQVDIDVDRSNGPGRGNVYVLASLARISVYDPADVMFAKSTDGGYTFGPAQRLNTDVSTTNRQWFGTLSVAPNGRIDVIWLDTRDGLPGSFESALYYCFSDDQGETWSINKRLSGLFDPTVGYPQQAKMGDYFDMVSDNGGAHLAWANTLNGEQDVYYTHITPTIVGLNEETSAQNTRCTINCSPNPFRDHSVIRYSIPLSCYVSVEICDLYGTFIRTIAEEYQQAGVHSVTLAGENLPTGFYLCRLSAGDQSTTTRLVRLK